MYGHADSLLLLFTDWKFMLLLNYTTQECLLSLAGNNLTYDGIQTGIRETGVEIPVCTLKCVIELFTAETRGKNVEHQINLFIQRIIYYWNNPFLY